MALLDVLKADWRVNRDDPRILISVTLFRLAAAARGRGSRPRAAAVPLLVFYKVLVTWIFTIELPVSVKAGPGLRIQHGYGLVVHPQTVLGAGVILKHGVTLGIRDGSVAGKNRAPRIGDGVVFGPGAQVLGDVEVGDRVRVAAGAIVLSDIPDDHNAIGVPARARARG